MASDISLRYTEWKPTSDLPYEEKLLRQKLESGAAVIFSKIGVTPCYCSLTDPEEFFGKILFISPKFWKPSVYYSDAQSEVLKAVGYLASENIDEASELFYKYCIDEPIRLADAIWSEQCIFYQNFFGRAILNGGARWTLQSSYPDFAQQKELTRYINGNIRMLKNDAKEFAAHKDMRTYRKSIPGSLLYDMTDAEFIVAFDETKNSLLAAYKNLKEHIVAMSSVPQLFGCVNYLLRGGKYQDIKGICKVVGVSDIEKNSWTLNPERYV